MIVLGIESTAHTLGMGIAKTQGKRITLLANERSQYAFSKKGFIPRLLAEHHAKHFKKTLESALDKAKVSLADVDAIAYSFGPGMGHALHVGFVAAKSLSIMLNKPLVPVNHCIAHVESAKWACKMKDPLALYASGGNTQLLALQNKRYHVYGETLDIGIGNFLDVLARDLNLDSAIDVMNCAKKGKKLIVLPYPEKGMNFSFTGLQTFCKKLAKSEKKEDICFSIQETAFAMLTEATERALYHTQKKELVACGGVACNSRLQQMLSAMCKDAKARFCVAPNNINSDNGGMIAICGCQMLLHNAVPKAEG
ncbi:MAG: KEOPS complex N(6)-L-threonylcarbamoyladenine synthase Kae1, partial [Candidatus Micrarchaeota archaeon]